MLGLGSFAYVLRLTRTSVIENMNADYVRTATAKGLSRPRVVRVHILRNSLIPVMTFLGADLGALMGGAIVTEGIFNVPGVGNRLYRAVLSGEGPTVVSIVTVLVLIYCWPTCSLTCSTPGLTRGSAMTPDNTTTARHADSRRPARRTEHFVADVSETPLQITDRVKDEAAPLSLWGEAWKNLRKQPLFLISAFLILVVVAVSALPGTLLADRPDLGGLPAGQLRRRPGGGPPAGLHPAGLRRLRPRHLRHPVLGDGGPASPPSACC